MHYRLQDDGLKKPHVLTYIDFVALVDLDDRWTDQSAARIHHVM